jgi:NCS2 family nucleobase:cation symporter-2
MMSRMIDPRKIFILGISIICGLGATSLVQEFSQIQNPYVRPIIASPLYVSTLVAICLTLIFRIGVTKRHREVVKAGVTTYDDIRLFMERQGSIWGARQEIINRSISALNELLELVVALDLTREPMQLEFAFDEFSMDFNLDYEGRCLDINQDYSAVASLDEEVSVARLALLLIRKDADRMSVSEAGGRQRIMLHFDH